MQFKSLGICAVKIKNLQSPPPTEGIKVQRKEVWLPLCRHKGGSWAPAHPESPEHCRPQVGQALFFKTSLTGLNVSFTRTCVN